MVGKYYNEIFNCDKKNFKDESELAVGWRMNACEVPPGLNSAH